MDLQHSAQALDSILGRYPNFPTEGILFYDIMPLFSQAKHAKLLFDTLIAHIEKNILSRESLSAPKIDVVVGLEARGFLIGPTVAQALGAAFVPVRKKGKLPGETLQATYEKEYGKDVFEIQKGSIKKGQNVLIIDDLIATGGSAKAAGDLVKQAGGKLVEYVFIVELTFLNGRDKLDAPSSSIVQKDE